MTALAMLAALAVLIIPPHVLAGSRIPRDRAEVRAFRAEHPCPATGRTRGSCPGWEVDHTQALCAGGLDHRSNLQWLSKEDHRFKTLVDVRECRKARRAGRQEQ